MLDPGEVGVTDRGHAILPAFVLTQALPAPVRDVKGWVGKDEVGFEIRVTV